MEGLLEEERRWWGYEPQKSRNVSWSQWWYPIANLLVSLSGPWPALLPMAAKLTNWRRIMKTAIMGSLDLWLSVLLYVVKSEVLAVSVFSCSLCQFLAWETSVSAYRQVQDWNIVFSWVFLYCNLSTQHRQHLGVWFLFVFVPFWVWVCLYMDLCACAKHFVIFTVLFFAPPLPTATGNSYLLGWGDDTSVLVIQVL